MRFPKFNINQDVFVFEKNEQKIIKTKVKGIIIHINGEKIYAPTTDGTKGLIDTHEYKVGEVSIKYELFDSIFSHLNLVDEYLLFSTREDLIEKTLEKLLGTKDELKQKIREQLESSK